MFYSRRFGGGPGFAVGPKTLVRMNGRRALPGINYFTNEGATTPFYNSIFPPAIYVAARDTTYFGQETNYGELRVGRIAAYNHTTRVLDPPQVTWRSNLTDDDHGALSPCLDHQAYVHAFGGEHNGIALKHSVETAPGSNRYVANSDITDISAAYPSCIAYNNQLHLYARHNISASSKMTLAYKATTALASGVPTWAAMTQIIDLGADSRLYAGTRILVGSEVWFVFTRADYSDTNRKGIYFAKHDLADLTLYNHDKSVSVAAGAQPLDLTTANTSFRLFTHSAGNATSIPQFALDENGYPVIVFGDGDYTVNTSIAVKVIAWNGVSWDAPITLGTTAEWRNLYAVVSRSVGVDVYYDDNLNGTWDRNGVIKRVRRISGVWQ